MINKVILMGRLTADPELRQTSSGVAMCRFSVAVNRPFVSKDAKERQADFINVVAWRQTAEFVAKYFNRGKMIIVEGNLRNNNYTDANGVKHYSMDVYADNVTFGECKSQSTAPQAVAPQQATYVAKQQPLENYNTDYNMGDFNDFEVIAGESPF